MAQNEGVSLEAGKQAVSIRIKMKWHKMKECHLKQVNTLSIRIKMKWHKMKECHLKQVNKLCQLGSR